MGMFDEIVVKQNLPLPEELKALNIDWQKHRFQTKDLENCLGVYLVCENGFLHERIAEYEYTEYTAEEKAKLKSTKRFFSPWKEVIEKSSYHKKIENYHGFIAFYTYEELSDDEDFWVEFKAFFSYGKLDKIDLLEFRKEPSRKITNEKWKKEQEAREKHPWSVFKRYASYFGWRVFWKFMSKVCYKLSGALGSIQMLIIRHLL